MALAVALLRQDIWMGYEASIDVALCHLARHETCSYLSQFGIFWCNVKVCFCLVVSLG